MKEISNPAELDLLPSGSVVLDGKGRASQKEGGAWYRAGEAESRGAGRVLRYGHARLVSTPPPPTVVVLCGSTRFRDEFAEANRDLTLLGQIVVAPGVFGHSGDDMTEEQKAALDLLHFRKIDMADHVVVVAPGDYIGESTAREIDYAYRTGKPVYQRNQFTY